jgi:hypothetical protein
VKVYFSHSYRDVALNGYFLEHFLDDEIVLHADQKTDVWCVAKLERFLGELDGFLSIITRRPTEDDATEFSPYIGQELSLARRARVPRLLFVDSQVLDRHSLKFPEDAVAFNADAPQSDLASHRRAIDRFRLGLEGSYRTTPERPVRQAAVVVGEDARLRGVAEDVGDLLRRSGFGVIPLFGRRPGRGLEDIRLLEWLRSVELCAFVLDEELGDEHIALAMAHADFIPSMRLQYSSAATKCDPEVSGMIRWRDGDEMLVEFRRQLESYQQGLVLPVERARATTATDAARSLGTMRWQPRDDNLWDRSDGPGLVGHVHPDHGFVRDEVGRVRGVLGAALATMRGREGSMEVCTALYDGLRRLRFAYEIEPATSVPGQQAIRTPAQITTHRTATCLDVACLFASLLYAAGQNPLLVVLDGPQFAHALAGYRAQGEPPWDSSGIGDLRGAVARGDAVLFEATGAIESDEPVGDEPAEARRERVFGFLDAVTAARTTIRRPELVVRHFVDVRSLLEHEPP